MGMGCERAMANCEGDEKEGGTGKQLTRPRPSAPWSVVAEAVGVSIALVIAGTVRCHQKARKHRIESAAAAADDAEAEAAIDAARTKGRNPREGPSRPLMPPKNLQCALPLPPLMIPQPWMPPAVTTAPVKSSGAATGRSQRLEDPWGSTEQGSGADIAGRHLP